MLKIIKDNRIPFNLTMSKNKAKQCNSVRSVPVQRHLAATRRPRRTTRTACASATTRAATHTRTPTCPAYAHMAQRARYLTTTVTTFRYLFYFYVYTIQYNAIGGPFIYSNFIHYLQKRFICFF